MAVCKKCGAQLNDGIEFCTMCGAPIDFQSSDSTVVKAAEMNAPQANDFPLDEAPKWAPEQTVPVQQETPAQEVASPQWMLDQQAAPIKKHSSAKKVIIIAACAVLVLGIGGFIGKTYFSRDLMKLFMGQNKYAQSVEETATYALTDKTVHAFDTVVQSLPTQGNNQAADFESSLHIDLDSNFSSQLTQQMGGNDTVVKNVLAYVNALSIKGSSNVNGQAMQSTIEIAHNSNKLLSCNMFMDKSGKQYYQLPDLSKTYLTTGSTANPLTFAVKYDSVKLNASLRAIAKVYIDAIPDAKTTIQENQSLTIEGITVNAEKISLTFTSEQCKQIVKKMLETIKKDDYLYTVVSDNYNTLSKDSTKMDKAQYAKALDSAISSLDSDSSSSSAGTLVVSAYVTPDGTQVARSYEVAGMKGDVSKASLNLIFTKKNGLDEMAANVLSNGKEYATATILYNTANSGTMQFSVKDSDQNMNIGAKVEFSGLSKAKFANRDVELGTYKMSISDPDNFLSKALTQSSEAQSSLLKDVLKSSITCTNSLVNNKLNSKVALDITGIAKISVNNTTTSKASSAITIPTVSESNAIVFDSTATASESQEKLQAAYESDAMKYFSNLLGKDADLAALLKSMGIDKDSLDAYANANSQTY